MLSRLRLVLACTALALTVIVAAPAHAALDPYDVPVITCESSNLASITLHVCGGASGAPAGLSIHWKKKSDYDLNGWADGPDMCELSLSGQPSMQHPDKSRWELLPGECEDIKIGDLNFDETGLSAHGCGVAPLECGTEYVFRWFAHAGRGFGRSDWGGDLICATAACPQNRCTYTQGYWGNHGGPPGCDRAPVNHPDPEWCPAILQGGLQLGDRMYSPARLCSIMSAPGQGVGLIALAHQLIAAQLNLCNGAGSCPDLVQAIADANAAIGNADLIALLGTNCGGKPPKPAGCAPPPPSNDVLTAFNEGELCGNGHCGDPALKSGAKPGGTTEAKKASWGNVKSHYR